MLYNTQRKDVHTVKTYFCNVSTVSEEDLMSWFAAMSEERKEKCRRIANEIGKKCCIAADHLIRTAVSEALNCPPEDVKWEKTESGKPYVVGNPVYISISHTEYTVACALSEGPVGIDLELNRSVMASAQERICSPEEWNYIRDGKTDAERSLRFIELWTRKEAIFKLDGILPRRDKEIPALHPETLGISVKTEKMGKYTLSVAELIL